jgi:hypothetical protein
VSKQVNDLAAQDLERHPIWVFPMDQSVEDEASVRPVEHDEIVPDGMVTIVRCIFRDQSGRQMFGYVYPRHRDDVDERLPVAWCGSLCITFWNGMREPSPSYVATVVSANLQWPLSYQTDTERAPACAGKLDGLYYLQEDRVRCIPVAQLK